jgi:hypothetical protein
MLIFKVFYERVFLCYSTAEDKQKAIDKIYRKYLLSRPNMNREKFTAKRSY